MYSSIIIEIQNAGFHNLDGIRLPFTNKAILNQEIHVKKIVILLVDENKKCIC